MIYEICTRKCTQNARFQADFGRFSCLLCNDNRVQMQMNEARRQNRASTLFPRQPGLSNNECGKDCDFISVSVHQQSRISSYHSAMRYS